MFLHQWVESDVRATQINLSFTAVAHRHREEVEYHCSLFELNRHGNLLVYHKRGHGLRWFRILRC